MNRLNTYRKNRLSGWLLMIALFFGSLIFSANSVSDATTVKQQAVPTGWMLSGDGKPFERITARYISYHAPVAYTPSLKLNKNRAIALLAFNKLVPVKLNSLLKQGYLFSIRSYCLPIKTIHQGPEGDLFEPIIG